MRKAIILTTVAAIFTACSGGAKQGATTQTPLSEEVSALDSTQTVTTAIDKPINLTTEEFKRLVMNYEANASEWKYLGDKPAIVDFWATWCPPCKAIAPILDDLAREYAGQIYIYKVDVDKEPKLASAFGIQSIPTLLFVPMNGAPKVEMGAIPKETFKERIDNFMLAK